MCAQVDFLAITETKLDSSFPTAYFNHPGFRTPYSKDITEGSDGLPVYRNRDMLSRMISVREFPKDIQIVTNRSSQQYNNQHSNVKRYY